MAAENRNDDDTQTAPVTGEDLQRNRNARLALSVQVSRALRELGYCSLGATELPDTVSDKINWAFASRDRGLIMYRNPALRVLPRLSGADALLDPLASSLSAFPRYQNEHCSTGSVWCTVRVCGGVLECADVAHE
jgi:hypothetical protein